MRKTKTYRAEKNNCGCEKTNFFWKLLGILSVLAAGAFALLSLFLQKKNEAYRDALIDLSEQLPEEDV